MHSMGKISDKKNINSLKNKTILKLVMIIYNADKIFIVRKLL